MAHIRDARRARSTGNCCSTELTGSDSDTAGNPVDITVTLDITC